MMCMCACCDKAHKMEWLDEGRFPSKVGEQSNIHSYVASDKYRQNVYYAVLFVDVSNSTIGEAVLLNQASKSQWSNQREEDLIRHKKFLSKKKEHTWK